MVFVFAGTVMVMGLLMLGRGCVPHASTIQPVPSFWQGILDIDMPVWVPVRSEEKCEQHRQLARDVAALRAERQHLRQVLEEASIQVA
jgi:hypothetical protein